MSTLTGKATIFGIDGTIAYTGVATTESHVHGIDLTDKFDKAQLKTRGGDTLSQAAFNRRAEVTFEVIVFDPASPGTIATAKSKVKLPDPLAVVTIAGMGITYLDGTWNYAGEGKLNLTNEGFIKLTIPCERFGADLGSAAAFAVVT